MPDISTEDIAAIIQSCCPLNCGSSKDKVGMLKAEGNLSMELTARLSILTWQKESHPTHSRPYEHISLVPGKDVLPMTVKVRSIIIKPEADTSKPWKSSCLLVLPATPPSNTTTRTKGTPARKEKDSRKLCVETTHDPSEKTVKRSVSQQRQYN